MKTLDTMQTSGRLATRLALAIASVFAGLPVFVGASPIGVSCTAGPNFNLETAAGDIQLPDGTTMYMWGYKVLGQPFQHPGPVLCVNAGDTVTVTLVNNLPQPVSIMFPGQENVLVNDTTPGDLTDNVPAQPEFDASVPPRATSLTNTAAASGGVVKYSFVAGDPGTYLYESGTAPQKQVRMGLFGALIVRPSGAPDQLNGSVDSRFTTQLNSPSGTGGWDEEFLVMLSEIDPYQHWAVEANPLINWNFNNYHPRYWLLNGRGLPDTLADNGASFLPTQPYGGLARVHPFGAAVNHPYPGAIRYLNVGTEDYPFHPHGNNGTVVGRDGRRLETALSADSSFEKFLIPVGPGQTWDVLFHWKDDNDYSESNPVDITIPQIANQFFGQFYSFSPYLGIQGARPPNWDSLSLNTCGEYYIISHNHALFQLTSWGVNMTGPGTYMRVDPPIGSPQNTCAE